jgi:hypothetical protein
MPRSAPCCAALPMRATCAENAVGRSNRTNLFSGRAIAVVGFTTALGAERLQYALGACTATAWNGTCTWRLALAVAAPSTIERQSNIPSVRIGAARILRLCNARDDATPNGGPWFAQLAGSCLRRVGPARRPVTTHAARGYFGAAVGSVTENSLGQMAPSQQPLRCEMCDVLPTCLPAPILPAT